MIEANPAVSPWLKNRYALSPAPGGPAGRDAASGSTRRCDWADEGLWSSAAVGVRAALGRRPGAAAGRPQPRPLPALAGRRRRRRRGPAPLRSPGSARPTEAVDLEALCQQIAPLRPDDRVEHVQLIWPLRDRDGLLETLRADPTRRRGRAGPDRPGRPRLARGRPVRPARPPRARRRTTGLKADEIPRILGRVLVGQEIVALETYDDGRLDAPGRPVHRAGRPGDPPGAPEDQGRSARSPGRRSPCRGTGSSPTGSSRTRSDRLTGEQGVRMIREVWPETPMPYLGGRTPLAGRAAGDAEVPLRAAVLPVRAVARGLARAGRLRRPPGPAERSAPSRRSTPRRSTSTRSTWPGSPRSRSTGSTTSGSSRSIAGPAGRCSLEVAGARPRRPWSTARRVLETGGDRAAVGLLRPGHASPPAGARSAEAFDWVRRGRQADPRRPRGPNAPSGTCSRSGSRPGPSRPRPGCPSWPSSWSATREDPTANQVDHAEPDRHGPDPDGPQPRRPRATSCSTAGRSRRCWPSTARGSPRPRASSASRRPRARSGPPAAGRRRRRRRPLDPRLRRPAPPAAGGDKPKLIIPGR